MKSSRLWALVALVLGVIFLRLVPHPANFSPVAALALFSGAQFSKRWTAYAVSFGAMFLTDWIIGFHNTMWAVYLAFALVVTLGLWVRRQKNTTRIFTSSLVGSVLFFLITNFAVWISSGMYPINMQGLVSCYLAGIPFLDRSVVGDLFFNAAIFGAWALVETRLPQEDVQAIVG